MFLENFSDEPIDTYLLFQYRIWIFCYCSHNWYLLKMRAMNIGKFYYCVFTCIISYICIYMKQVYWFRCMYVKSVDNQITTYCCSCKVRKHYPHNFEVCCRVESPWLDNNPGPIRLIKLSLFVRICFYKIDFN